MERMFFFASGGDVDRVSKIMAEFEKNQGVKVPEDIQKKIGETIHGEGMITRMIINKLVCRFRFNAGVR